MTERADRIARNEALFREVNERINEFPPDGSPEEPIEFLCECGDAECTATIVLTGPEYERVRATPTDFAVLEGHEAPDVEGVIASNDRFLTVRKHEEAADIARDSDPRRDS
ncbi:MAG TPA: hypothetical protein VFW80_04345 [Gaiellaceae bacterium]|nr:hypothetical protein [Gaiellaceae bacterium]